jgi:dTDP-4-dehydrorhamnose 3,5-epimerase
MKSTALSIPGAFQICGEPRVDDRGYFLRTFDAAIAVKAGLNATFVQENQSLSIRKHTIRGLHFQMPPHAETKLVRVVKGALLDVFVDLRAGSPTFWKFEMLELREDNFMQAWIPPGCAHGFCTLSDDVVIAYKVDSYYAAQSEGGILWSDPTLQIPWPTKNPTLSDRDARQTLFKNFVSPFRY